MDRWHRKVQCRDLECPTSSKLSTLWVTSMTILVCGFQLTEDATHWSITGNTDNVIQRWRGEIMRSNTANYHISHFYLTVLPAPSSQVEYIFSCTWISHVDWSRINRCLTASPLTIENNPEGGCAYVLAVLLCVPGNNFLLCGIAHYASIRKLGILLIQPATRNSEQPFLKILIQFLKMSVWLIM